jgi:hypothetical protein
VQEKDRSRPAVARDLVAQIIRQWHVVRPGA